MADKKYLNLNSDVLLEYEYDSANISEYYTIWSDISRNTRNFLSKTNINNIDNNLFVIDSIQKKYAKIDPTKFNFIKVQDYFSGPVYYDKVTIYLPTNYNFSVYKGFYLKIYTYDYINKLTYALSNFYYDSSQIQSSSSGSIIYADMLIDLATPFVYNQKEWGKYLTFYIPSPHEISNQRLINPDTNIVVPDSINDNLTSSIGLSTNSPIFFELSFITSTNTVFGTKYYYLGDTFKLTIPNQAEYQTLGVVIEESTQGDFFEIYGTYKNSNENMDDFIEFQEANGRRMNIEYVITLYEENLISGFPVTFLVTDNFSQKIEYRPIIKYSNTTAVIDVEMKIIDLVNYSTFSRRASIGLTTNLLKYGKTLSKLEVGNVYRPKIYNYKYDKNYDFKASSNITEVNIIKVPFPILINNYKILASNYNPGSSSDYKSMGLLNIILTPFDNIIKFQIAKQDDPTSQIIPYDLSEILLNSKLNLVFRSDTKSIEKEIYYQTDENKFNMGVVVFKINQEDMTVLKQINKEKSDNFYLILTSNKTKTLLYSGKFKIFENVVFLNTSTAPTTTNQSTSLVENPIASITTQVTGNTSNQLTTESAGMNSVLPVQFDSDGIPLLNENSRGSLDYYKNVILWVKSGLNASQVVQIDNNIKALGVKINYAYRTPSTGPIIVILERVPVETIENLKVIPNVVNLKELELDFGWKKTIDTTITLSSINPTPTDITNVYENKIDDINNDIDF